jgi:D-aminoacyl-tRNA deacylase
MSLAIAVSTKNMASMNLFARFLEKGFEPTDKKWHGHSIYQLGEIDLIQTDEEVVYADSLNDVSYDQIVVACTHRSSAGVPAMTVHYIGNFGPADLGGKPGVLGVALANPARNIFQEMKNGYENFEITMETTHHGPELYKPCCYVELGSSEKQWKDEDAADFLAGCIIKGLQSRHHKETAIGIGGGHYCDKFNDLTDDYAFGHIMPKYAIEYLNEKMARQMIEKTVPKATKIFIDKKGTKKQSEIRKMLSEYEIEMV